MQPLEKSLRRKLESTVKEARDVAEEAAKAVVEQLEVGAATPKRKLDDGERQLRNRLRAHGRQLGDVRSDKGEQETERLLEEIAYQHWHRMLFARFLAENELLMYPDPDDPVAVTLEECEDLAADEGARNGWELAARFAAKMLPQIFRVDSPVFALALPTEMQHKLEQMLSKLPTEVFQASDSLGWVYQFWQTKRKKEINESEVKIGARELPAVTQLFTEPYMVSFLLDNSLGAWWAARRLTEDDLRNATSEQQLREKAALPGVPLEYLRFVWDDGTNYDEASKSDGTLFDQGDRQDSASAEPRTPQWRPAAGTFDAWPESLSELRSLDPCCGSGHFLVAALLMLTPMRMELEGLSASQAVGRVLSENLHGLEIDQRCVELAAFALALTAWRFPDAGGYRVLPTLNVACCGLSVTVPRDEWADLAGDDKSLRIALNWMHDEFSNSDVLGSLVNPKQNLATQMVSWDTLGPLFRSLLARAENLTARRENSVTAEGMFRSATLMCQSYHLFITNVPYLVRGKQSETLQNFSTNKYPLGQRDVATVFLLRMLEGCKKGGTTAVVLPQNWLFLSSYTKLRKSLLKQITWNIAAPLGSSAFETISGEVVKAVLFVASNSTPKSTANGVDLLAGVDVGKSKGANEKSMELRSKVVQTMRQAKMLQQPDARMVFGKIQNANLVGELADCYQGLVTGDIERFTHKFWEVEVGLDWVPFRRSNNTELFYGDVSEVLFWQNGTGQLQAYAKSARSQLHDMHESGNRVWGKKGIAINRMGNLRSVPYYGEHFDNNVAVVCPNDLDHLDSLTAFFDSTEFPESIRRLDQAIKVTNRTLVKVPCNLEHWRNAAALKHRFGLPQPYSDDPTQWVFHGHPTSITAPLQVSVARLLGYRWPAELAAKMELATDARYWIQESSKLVSHADDDGIVCLPAIGTEAVADERLLNLLNQAFKDGLAVEAEFQHKLNANDTSDPLTLDLLRRDWQPTLPDNFNDWLAACLEAVGHAGKTLSSWLRDKFFTQHCQLFHHRPFIWQIWDGVKDGFSVLINYHRFDNKLLETLIYTHLNDWIKTQKSQVGKVDGSEEKLAAAEKLKRLLEKIREGESPHDIFIRWKPLEEQPIGWNPDLNDGVRLNIRPFMTVGDVGKAGAGILRDKPNCKWTKDRGKDVESAPWYQLGPKYGGKPGDRINDHHLKLADKQNHGNGRDL